jgi:hypothetical protein
MKVNKKSANDMNDIIPITISDPIAIKFEKDLLTNINAQLKDMRGQLKIVNKSAVRHASFLFVEAENYFLSRKTHKINFIDSSNAFDSMASKII